MFEPISHFVHWLHVLTDVQLQNFILTTQTIILALTALVALWTIRCNTLQERRRATVDLVLRSFEDASLIDAKLKANEIFRAGLNIPVLLSDQGATDRFAIFSALNRYEFIATGLEEGAFDRKVYKELYYSSAVQDWDKFAPLIEAYRQSSGRMSSFRTFERLIVDNWKLHSPKPDSTTQKRIEAWENERKEEAEKAAQLAASSKPSAPDTPV